MYSKKWIDTDFVKFLLCSRTCFQFHRVTWYWKDLQMKTQWFYQRQQSVNLTICWWRVSTMSKVYFICNVKSLTWRYIQMDPTTSSCWTACRCLEAHHTLGNFQSNQRQHNIWAQHIQRWSPAPNWKALSGKIIWHSIIHSTSFPEALWSRNHTSEPIILWHPETWPQSVCYACQGEGGHWSRADLDCIPCTKHHIYWDGQQLW